ncbi:MAG: hypothetical protein RLZZ74_1313, partial [Cyanobacteriota bacterium]
KELSAANSGTTNQDNQLTGSDIKKTAAKPAQKEDVAIPKSTTVQPNIQSDNQLKIKPNNSQAIVLDGVSEAKTEPTTDMTPKTEIASDSSDLVKPPAKPAKLPASDVADRAASNAANNLEQVEPKPTSSKIVITESNSPQKPEAEIIIPSSESVKIVESEVESNIASDLNSDRAIANLDTQSTSTRNFSEPPSTSNKFLWWKKFLVGVRQAMEALARQLPNQV